MAKSKGSRSRQVPGDSVQVYRGPIRIRDRGTVDDSVAIRMSYSYNITGSISAGVHQWFGTNGVNSCQDWNTYVAAYDEYRVLAFEVDYLPHYPDGNFNGSTGEQHGAGAIISTHSPTNPFPFTSKTMNDFVAYSNWEPFYTSRPYKRTWRMESAEESQFAPTSLIGTHGFIGHWAPNATTANSYGFCIVTYVVQFRGRS